MRWSIIFELFKINILYSNPQAMANLRRKREKKAGEKYSMASGMIRQQLLQIIAFTLLYSYLFISIDYQQLPGILSFQIATFFLMAFAQTFSAMFAIFYESNDLKIYAHMPISSSELYAAKTLASIGMGSTFLMPILGGLAIVNWQLHGPLGLVLALPIFFIIWVECFILSLLLLHLAGRFLLKLKYRKVITTGLMSGISLLGIILISTFNSDSTITFMPQIPFFRGFYDISQNLVAVDSLLHFWLPLGLLTLLGIYLYRVIMPRYYRFALANTAKQAVTKKKVTKPQKLSHLLIRHHLQTFAKPTLISQSFLLQVIIPLSAAPGLIFSAIDNGHKPSELVSTISLNFAGSFLLSGLFLGIVANHMSTFVGVAMSLEKENYPILKSLPLNFKAFARQKFFTAFVVQNLPAFAIYLFLGLYLRLNPLLLLAFLSGYLMAGGLMAQGMYRRDLKKLTLVWQDITHLLARDGANWKLGFISFVSMILGYALIGLSVLLTLFWKPLIVNQIIFTLAIGAALPIQWLLYQKFWKTLS